MLPLLAVLTSLQLAFALPSPQAQSQFPESLVILDTGVGHRSTPVPRWRTSLRSLSTKGTNATTLTQFGPASNGTNVVEPVGAYALAYSTSTSFLFSATGQGIIRTNVDGSDAKLILNDDDSASSQIVSITVAEKEAKIYYGNLYTGLIQKADFDGRNVELVRNVSQGLDYDVIPSYVPANFYPGGIVVDEARGWLYWSAVHGDDDGSIRRAPLNGEGEEQVLVSGINMPGQLRINGDNFYWVERGRWNTSPTAIKYLDRHLSQLPSTPTSPNIPVPTGTLIDSSQSPLFFENDYTGEQQALSIRSFVSYNNGVELTLWFVVESSGRTIIGKLVQANWRGSGGSRGPVFKVLNADTKDVGVPIGLEYAR
jgi:hypothetical protein